MDLITPNEITAALPPRAKNTNKSAFGHVLVIGGDYGMAGAVQMAGMASARVGAGLTSLTTRSEHVATITAAQPELMCHAVKDAEDLKPLLAKATVIVIGPGLGQGEWSQQLLNSVINLPQPKVVDADGLNLLAKKPQGNNKQQNNNWILTPHPGEAARLLNTNIENIQNDRVAAIAQLQKKYGGVIVLKGAGTLVQGENNQPAKCESGNPGMASGGMGDILSGVIGGLVAQGLNLETAARVGVLVHALAGDKAAAQSGERGLLATDLLPFIHQIVNN